MGMILLACQCARELLQELNDYKVEGTGEIVLNMRTKAEGLCRSLSFQRTFSACTSVSAAAKSAVRAHLALFSSFRFLTFSISSRSACGWCE